MRGCQDKSTRHGLHDSTVSGFFMNRGFNYVLIFVTRGAF